MYDPEVDIWESKTTNKFQDFNGNQVEEMGLLKTDIELNNWKVKGAELMITPKNQNKMPLLGAYLIRRLGLKITQATEAPNPCTTGQERISNVNPDLKAKLYAEFKNLFSRQGRIKNHIVRAKFKKPLQAVQQKGRRVPIALQNKVAEEIRRLTREGHIKKLRTCNEDHFISPIVITVKQDGSLKLALDSKKHNEWVVKNKYQMPNIDELVDQIAQIITSKKSGTVWFTTVDLAYAYGQLLLAWETAKHCNFSVVGGETTGTYQFQFGFYGLADMPAEFQQAMDRTLGNQKGVFAFIDDVLIISKGSKEEHEQLVRNTLKKMDKQEMSLKLEKCTFGNHEIEWLGCKITQDGINPLKGKIESIQQQQRPKTLKQLRSLLGAAHQLN